MEIKQNIETVNLDDLEVDPRMQREIQEAHVRKLVNKFNPALFSAPLVSRRDTGQMVILDGQQHVEVGKRVGVTHCDAVILEGLTLQQESQYFTDLNKDRKNVGGLDLFKNAVFRGNPHAVEFKDAVEDAGFSIGGKGIHGISNALKAYYTYGPVHFRNGLCYYRNTFGKKSSQAKVDGIRMFCCLDFMYSARIQDRYFSGQKRYLNSLSFKAISVAYQKVPNYRENINGYGNGNVAADIENATRFAQGWYEELGLTQKLVGLGENTDAFKKLRSQVEAELASMSKTGNPIARAAMT